MKTEFGPLQELYDNKAVMEIIVDAHDDVYWEEKGKMHEANNLFKNEQEIIEVMKLLLKSVNRSFESIVDGFADLRLSDGTRVAMALPPISINGPTLVIRKIFSTDIGRDDLLNWGVITQEGIDICQALISKNKSLILAGNASSGKTTHLNLLIDGMDKSKRVVTVEKVATMDTYKRKRTLRLETPTCKQSEMIDLIQKASMLRADTVVVNELMGAEAFETVKLMREGYHVMATLTAEGVSDALKKCELLCLMGQYGIGVDEIKYHVASGVDAVIFQERLENGKRVVSNISLVEGLDENGRFIIKPLFVYDEVSAKFITTPEGKKLLATGLK